MIVKDEGPRIERCLSSVADQIDTWAILDTGSTDDTVERIYGFFEPRSIPGTLGHGKFVNFSYTRNEALALAYTHRSQFDYLLLVDADMEMVGEIPKQLTSAAYHMLQKGDGLTYWNTRLLRSDIEFRYIGVTHEYLDTPGATAEKLHGPWFRDHADGGNRPGKIERDIKLLEEDVKRHPDNARSWYYLGQSYREAGKLGEAVNAYGARICLGGWDEEIWHAQLSGARCIRDFVNTQASKHTPPIIDESSWLGDPLYNASHALFDKKGVEEWKYYRSAFIEGELAAYNTRPTRSEPLYDLARHYREKGANAASLLFSIPGSKITKPDDLLFVEDYPYEWGFKEEISICGFYLKEHRETGHDACEELALSRVAPAALREQSWSNLFHYTRPLSELAPSFFAKKIKFEPPDGYRPMNPSITRLGDRMYMNVRTVNYLIGDDGRYQFEGPIKTRNFLFEVTDDLSVMRPTELKLPEDFPFVWGEVLGLEDVRLFPLYERLYCSATSRQHDHVGLCEIVVAEISMEHGELCEWFKISSPEKRTEKNWIPVIGTKDRYIYKCDPLQIINDDGRLTSNTTPPVDLRHCSGSTQAIPFDGGHLAMVHERQAHLDSMHGQRNYQQRFLWLDDDLKIKKISRRFMLGSGQGEFPCGMCMHPDGERLVISYGVLDREAWLATVDADEVAQMLRHVGEVRSSIFEEGPTALAARIGSAMGLETLNKDGKSVVRLSPDFSIVRPTQTVQPDRAFPWEAEPLVTFGTGRETNKPWPDLTKDHAELARLSKIVNEARGVIEHKPIPAPSPMLAKPSYNSVLKSEAEVRCAIHTAESYGWPIHPDFAKNWDVVLAVNAALEHTHLFGAWIIDAGADRRSTFLPTLRKAGYVRLLGLNILEATAEVVNGITYDYGDIENLSEIRSGAVDFIAGLSTIEHGVDVAKFLHSAYRCLKPGGHLFVSTDIWKDPIVTPLSDWRIFTPGDIMSLVTSANQVGLSTTTEISFVFGDRVAHHAGLEYTFINLLFRKDR